jgi:hypothetical protein
MQPCYGVIVPPQVCIVKLWLPVRRMWLFGDTAFEKAIEMKVLGWANGGPCRKKNLDSQRKMICVHSPGKTAWRCWEGDRLQVKEKGLRRNQPVLWTFSVCNYEKVNFCCLRQPVWSILLQQPRQTHTNHLSRKLPLCVYTGGGGSVIFDTFVHKNPYITVCPLTLNVLSSFLFYFSTSLSRPYSKPYFSRLLKKNN